MTDPQDTPAETLLRAAAIGTNAGLRFIYAGNLPGQVGNLESTYCPGCKTLLVERYGYLILDYKLTPEGACPTCKQRIPGRWDATFQGQITSHPFLPRLRRARSSLISLS